jgi:C1A family cysteine protease
MFAQIIVVLSLIVATFAAESGKMFEGEFYQHMVQFKLNFKDGAEFVHRLKIFSSNLEMINAHNANDSNTFQMGQNQFTHLTHNEFQDAVRVGGTRPPYLRKAPADFVHEAPRDMSSVPASIDWVINGAVTAVKDQGSCGSCWSFSTTGSLESAYFLKYKSLEVFSEQQLVSCDDVDAGCNGGWMDDAFNFVKKNGGLTSEAAYPYTSGTTTVSGTCVTSGYTNNANVAPKSYTDVTAGDVNALMSAVAQQPVSIAIQANQIAFQTYKSGVLTGTCGQRLDHGVLVVGYGTENGVDFWKVKNSWGETWGEAGYIKIERSSADKCGVLDAASYPNL